jgi:hypothetical protein
VERYLTQLNLSISLQIPKSNICIFQSRLQLTGAKEPEFFLTHYLDRVQLFQLKILLVSFRLQMMKVFRNLMPFCSSN